MKEQLLFAENYLKCDDKMRWILLIAKIIKSRVLRIFFTYGVQMKASDDFC